MPVYSSNSSAEVKTIVENQLQEDAIVVDTLTIRDGPFDIQAQANFKNSSGNTYCSINNSDGSINFPNVSGNTKNINSVDTNGLTSSITFNSSGDITTNCPVSRTHVWRVNGGQKMTCSANTVGLTSQNLQIPIGMATGTGGILVKGNSSDTWLGITPGSNGFVVNALSAGSSLNFQTGSTTQLQVEATTGNTIVSKNLTLSSTTADKVLTFTNTGGNTTFTSQNGTGVLTINTPTGGEVDFTVNGSVVATISATGLQMSQAPINLYGGSGYGLQIAQPSSNTFQIVNPNAVNDIYFASSHPTGSQVFQCNSATQMTLIPYQNPTTPPINYSNVAFQFQQALRHLPTNQSSNYTLLSTDSFVIMNSTAGTRTITLPAASGNFQNNIVTIMRRGGNGVTLSCSGCTVNGAASITLSSDYQAMRIYAFDGANWAAF